MAVPPPVPSSQRTLAPGVSRLLADMNAWLSRPAGPQGRPHARFVESIDDEYTPVPLEDDKVPGVLGSGSYGVVRRYQKKDLPHLAHVPTGPVAVKVIDKERMCRSQKNVKHLMVEIAVLKNLRHENIIRLYDVVHTETSIYMVMELCTGGELYYFIADSKRVEVPIAAKILKQLLQALEYIHANHVVHRDIKPENVLIDKTDHHIKVIDFGLAKYFGPTGQMGLDIPISPSPALSQAHPTHPDMHMVPPSPAVPSTPCGTDLYLALESICGILEGRQAYATTRSKLPKVDVYGVGVIGYAMLVGRLPYRTQVRMQQRTPQERQKRLLELRSKMSGGVVFPMSAQSLPQHALELVRDLMCNSPSERPSAREALARPWLQAAAVPVRSLPSGEVKELHAQRRNLTMALPAKRRTKKAAAAATATTATTSSTNPPAPAPVPPQPQPPQPVQQPVVPPPTPIEFDEEAEALAFGNDAKGKTQFKDGWWKLMQEVREEEDDDTEVKGDTATATETCPTARQPEPPQPPQDRSLQHHDPMAK